MTDSVYAPPKADLSKVQSDADTPAFYVVSTLKMMVLFIATLGAYQLYWHYKNWRNHQQKDLAEGGTDADIWPWLRMIFAVFFVHSLFREVKAVADELGLAHQVCKSHVRRNTEELVAELQSRIGAEPDGSLAAIGVAEEQAQADLARLTELIATRPVEGGAELDRIQQRYKKAHPPQEGAKATVAYRLRLLFLDRANLWPRLTHYRRGRGQAGSGWMGQTTPVSGP